MKSTVGRSGFGIWILAIVVLSGLLLAAVAWWLHGQTERPIQVGIGIDLPVIYGAVIDPSDKNTGELFLEEHPRSRIRIHDMYNRVDPQTAVPDLEAAIAAGVRFFITTHASSHAVPSIHLFADGRALGINVASTSLLLSGQDDFLLRIIPDLRQEQIEMARQLERLPGSRLLVLQDTSNLAWTDPAFAAFTGALGASGRWRIRHHKLEVGTFALGELSEIVAEPFDALYILAGTFMPPIGNIAQLFHQAQPEAPILLTPWARSPAVLEQAGDAIDHLLMVGHYPSRHDDAAVDAYLRRFDARFGYTPQGMTLGTRQALELLDQAFAQGHDSPETVKRYLLATPLHQTSLGPIRFDAYGDVTGHFHTLTKLRRELE
ncbi:ABC transporter substrate-binding protein [Thiohalocapsa marina]|uniref:ABC transporter substrate-binding protein n=1 Tax=Thiohalocapsa marina TaxID=424902 RepID=A0A5M8FVE7_9GAMM|nr:ABC transporter substrate-binding protein [Thiohalocapsa marina]KAA6187811.1 ABC transporter substrate-binding protein [Thiohalocapsa marina]